MAYLISLWTAHHTLCQRYTLISSKITNLGHRVSPGNVTLCHQERHPLLLECLITSCRCMRMIVSASDSVSWSPYDQHYCVVYQKKLSKIEGNSQFGAPVQPRKECDTVTSGQISITASLYPIISWVYKHGCKSLQ